MFKLKETKDYLLLNHNRKLIDTKHSIDRFLDDNRFNTEQRKEVSDNITVVANRLLNSLLTKYKDARGVYGVHSISTGIGFVVDFRPDYLNRKDSTNQLILITLLPLKNRHFFKKDTTKIIVEKLFTELYINSLDKKELKRLKEGKSIPDYCYITYDSSHNFAVVQENNKYSYSDMNEFILVD